MFCVFIIVILCRVLYTSIVVIDVRITIIRDVHIILSCWRYRQNVNTISKKIKSSIFVFDIETSLRIKTTVIGITLCGRCDVDVANSLVRDFRTLSSYDLNYFAGHQETVCRVANCSHFIPHPPVWHDEYLEWQIKNNIQH